MDSPLTLLDLNCRIQHTLEQAFDAPLWVTGELSEARQASNGHFYGELIQKGEDGQTVVARARITCWARTYNLLRLRFVQESGQQLQAGLQVMIQAEVNYHPAYGLSLSMLDIDSSYTMGSMVQRRKQILQQLEADGILNDNKTLPMPRLANRIAVVSAAGAAGYGDFCNQLQHNEYNLAFTIRLFPAVMQGQHVEESVIAALQKVAQESQEWDVVVIIRGGGATADLVCFDSYPLASCVAQFPLPVIVGIGHERDVTVLDEVAHQRVKTPTAAAAFLIDLQLQELSLLESLGETIRQSTAHRLQTERALLERLSQTLPLRVRQVTDRHRHRLERIADQLRNTAANTLRTHQHRLDLLEQQARDNDPQRLLDRGYSMTTVHGRIATSPSQLQPGDIIETRLAKGTIRSVYQTELPSQKDPQQ